MRYLSLTFFLLVFAIPSIAQTRLTPGTAAPAFSISSLEGDSYDLSTMRGSVVVITFWSTKCLICRNEIPKLNNFTSRYGGKNVVFLALTMEDDDRVSFFLRNNPFNFHILPNSFGVVLQYADRDKAGNIDMAFPSYFLIDQSGTVAYRSYGWDKTGELDARISNLLATK